MVTYYNKTDLIKFGNYLLSDERRKLIENHPEPAFPLEQRLNNVNHADIENWMEAQKKD